MGAGHGPARRRQHHRQVDPHLRPWRAAPLRRHQHLPQGTQCREHQGCWPIRCRRRGDTVRQRHDLPPRNPVRPQGIRRISALYTPYNYEMGVDLREQLTLCDAGDVFTIPANLEKASTRSAEASPMSPPSGALPIMLGGDHSIGFPCVRGIAQCTSKKIGIIHFDRHIDIQEKDLDERMHTTPWYWATELDNVLRKTSSRSASAAGRCRGRG